MLVRWDGANGHPGCGLAIRMSDRLCRCSSAGTERTDVSEGEEEVELLGSYSNQNRVSRLQRIVAGQDPDPVADRTVRSPRQKERRLSPDQVSEVLQRSQAGETANALAKTFGVHRRTIVHHLIAG